LLRRPETEPHTDKFQVYETIQFVCLVLKATRGLEPISYRGVLLSTLLHATVYVFTQFAECTNTDCKEKGIKKIILVATRGLKPISYRGALLSTLLHATVHVLTQFAELK
jgi:hypothetical protein